MNSTIRIELSGATVLPDLNKLEGVAEDYARSFIDVTRMRYGHVKEMQKVPPELQTAWAIQELTKMSAKDMDQLYAEDAAELTKTIFGFVEKYFALAKQVWVNQEMEKA